MWSAPGAFCPIRAGQPAALAGPRNRSYQASVSVLSWSSATRYPEEELDPRTAAKRFQRVKEKLRTLAEEAGLLDLT